MSPITTGMILSASLLVSACANLKLTPEQCREYCTNRGKEMSSFHVGAAVPIINPKPAVDCRCIDPTEDASPP